MACGRPRSTPLRHSTSWNGCAASADYIFANQIDALVLPTAPTTYTVKQVLADPIQLNSRLGTYTNFVNLLDLCGLALPASMTEQRPAVRHYAAGAGRRTMRGWPKSAGCFMPTPSCRSARCNVPQPPLDADAGRAGRRRNRGGGGRRAFVGPAAQWRIARARRPPAGSDQDRAGLQALCAQRHGAAQARPAARRRRQGRGHRGRSLGAAVAGFRRFHRRRRRAAVDRHRHARRWRAASKAF